MIKNGVAKYCMESNEGQLHGDGEQKVPMKEFGKSKEDLKAEWVSNYSVYRISGKKMHFLSNSSDNCPHRDYKFYYNLMKDRNATKEWIFIFEVII